MAYGNKTLVKRMLAQALTSATPDTLDQLGDLMNIGNDLESNNVTDDVINTFLSDADADVNSTLNMLYGVPLKKKADVELALVSDIAFLPVTTISVTDPRILTPGDCLIITDGFYRDEVEVVCISGNTLTISPGPTHQYSVATTRVVRLKYPDPIPYVASRIAAANIYDKFFAAQSDKNESNYGKFFRNLARIKMQNILSGVSVLYGQHRKGNLSVNPNLKKNYGIEGEFKNGFKLDDPGGR